MARVMRDEMQRLGRPHLLSGEQAWTYRKEYIFFFGRNFHQQDLRHRE